MFAFSLLTVSLAAPLPKLPPCLALVPADAAGFATVRIADVLKADCFKTGRKINDNYLWDHLPVLTENLTVGKMTRATVIWPVANPYPGTPVIVVPGDVLGPIHIMTFNSELPAPFSKEPMGPPPFASRTRVLNGRTVWGDDDGWTEFLVISDRTIAMGSKASIEWLLNRKDKPTASAMTTAARQAVEADGFLAVRPAKYQSTLAKWADGFVKATPDLWSAELVTVRVSASKQAVFDVAIEMGDESKAKAAAKRFEAAYAEQLKGPLTDLISYLEAPKDEPDSGDAKNRENGVAVKQFCSTMNRGLKTHETQIRATVTLDALAPLAWPAFGRLLPFGMPVGYSRSAHDVVMSRIGEALTAYVKDRGSYPPAYLMTADGKPGLSWLVALLPFMGDDAKKLHAQFKLDEAWDSPKNRPLLDKMPKALWPEASEVLHPYRPRPNTAYRITVGKGLIFEGAKGVETKNVTDDHSETVVFFQAETTVPWTKPDVATIKGDAVEPKTLFDATSNVNAWMADGSMKTVSVRDRIFVDCLTRAGGEKTKAVAHDPAKTYPQYFPPR